MVSVRRHPLFAARDSERLARFDRSLWLRAWLRRVRALRAAYGRRWQQTGAAQRAEAELEHMACRLRDPDNPPAWCGCRVCGFAQGGTPNARLDARCSLFDYAPGLWHAVGPYVLYRRALRRRARRMTQSLLRRRHLLGL
jgi:hypothetical protein